jgi:DNA-directed RNA polymerase specialized sigma24 family protein
LKESDKFKEQAGVSSAEQVYDNYAPVMFSIITKIIPDNKKSEDTLAEVFLYVHTHLFDYNPRCNTFLVWLMNNARNIAINKLCNMQQGYPCDTNFKTLSLAEKSVYALYYFRSFSLSQIGEVLHLSNPIVEKLLGSAEAKVKT